MCVYSTYVQMRAGRGQKRLLDLELELPGAYGYWEANSVPLEDKQVLLTTEHLSSKLVTYTLVLHDVPKSLLASEGNNLLVVVSR